MASLVAASDGAVIGPQGRAGHIFAKYSKPGNGNAGATSSYGAVLVGGYGDDGPIDDAWIFDGDHGCWESLEYDRQKPRPLPRVDFAGCMVGSDRLYVFGGMESDGEQVESASPVSNTSNNNGETKVEPSDSNDNKQVTAQKRAQETDL